MQSVPYITLHLRQQKSPANQSYRVQMRKEVGNTGYCNRLVGMVFIF